MYAVVEGLDKAGKSYQIPKIKELLYMLEGGIGVQTVTEPSAEFESCKPIREFLATKSADTNKLYDLFKINRDELYDEIIRPYLNAGGIILSDRSFISSMVYQSSVGMMNILNDNQHKIPDVIFMVNITHETYLKRLGLENKPEQVEKELADPARFKKQQDRYKEALRLVKQIKPSVLIFNIDGNVQ